MHIASNDKCKHLQQIPDCLEWQNETASKHSPEPVKSVEKVVRQVFSPVHIDTDSQALKPAALNDAEDKGLSVFRLKYTDEEDVITSGKIKAQADNDAGKPEREFVAIANLSVNAVRQITDSEDKLGFAVYDTALHNVVSHADICHVQQGKKSFRSIRSKLLEIMQKNITLIKN